MLTEREKKLIDEVQCDINDESPVSLVKVQWLVNLVEDLLVELEDERKYIRRILEQRQLAASNTCRQYED